MKIQSSTVTVLVTAILSCALSAMSQQQTVPIPKGMPEKQPADDPCRTAYSYDFDMPDASKLPAHVEYLQGDESLASGLFAVETYAEGISGASFLSTTALKNELIGECQARLKDEATISTLQDQLKEVQRQVSLLRKGLHPKPALKR